MEPVSKVGFGGMPLSIKGRPSEEVGRRVLNAAIDAGMTLVDTADVYCLDDDDLGHNERLIASIGRRDEFRVATKAGLRRPGGAWVNDGSPKHIREACERSLRALQTDEIWLYQFHAPDLKVPFEKSVEAFAELHAEGKFRWFGLSNVSIEQIDRASRILPVASVQNRLSPYARESAGVAQECAKRNILFLAYSPLGGGFLTGKYRRGAELPPSALRSAGAGSTGLERASSCTGIRASPRTDWMTMERGARGTGTVTPARTATSASAPVIARS